LINRFLIDKLIPTKQPNISASSWVQDISDLCHCLGTILLAASVEIWSTGLHCKYCPVRFSFFYQSDESTAALFANRLL